MIKLSIITVVYNAEHLIGPTMASVINQSFRHYEHIIVDGQSSDNTLKVAQSFANEKTKIISEADNGIYDAMNKGLALAMGEYVLFLNAGDELHSKDSLVQIEWSFDADIYFSETILIDYNGKELGTRSDLSTRKLPKNLSFDSFKKGMVVSHQSFISKKLLCLPYDLRYHCSADIDWCLKVLKRTKKNVLLTYPISKYLVGGYSIKNQGGCWKERWQIMKHHFGFWQALLAHVFIISRFIYYRVMNLDNY
jgi:glycosyltransferase involved in cell wall biosynthesis